MVPRQVIGRHGRVVHAVDHDQVHPVLILPPQLLHHSLPGGCQGGDPAAGLELGLDKRKADERQSGLVRVACLVA